MPYTVTADEQHRLVEVMYSGQITTSTRICAMEDGAALLDAYGFARVLVDLRHAVAAGESRDVANALAARIAPRPRMRDSRLAYVSRPEGHADLLAGSVASARHAAVAHFHSRDDALHWLLLEP